MPFSRVSRNVIIIIIFPFRAWKIFLLGTKGQVNDVFADPDKEVYRENRLNCKRKIQKSYKDIF